MSYRASEMLLLLLVVDLLMVLAAGCYEEGLVLTRPDCWRQKPFDVVTNVCDGALLQQDVQ